MKPRFQPDGNPVLDARPETTLVDPEAYDASEQQFAASLEQKPGRAKFVADEPAAGLARSSDASNGAADEEIRESAPAPEEQAASGEQIDDSPAKPSDSWRQELQARITDYRARKRPRPPRYPSLQLKFDPPEDSGSKGVRTSESAAPLMNKGAVAAQPITSMRTPEVAEEAPAVPCAFEETGKLLQLPCVSSPLPLRDELAEPVFDQPRILEVPDVVPPPPALGGILIEPTEDVASERRPGFELPLQAAPMARRVLASAVDGVLVLAAAAAFAYIVFRITSNVPAPRQIALVFAALTGVFWSGYQYLLLVYAGITPGLKLARLRLSRFDGRSVPKTLRRWRVLASILSGLSLTLGYAWCFFDEDQLCWHDRITHTYMAPENQK